MRGRAVALYSDQDYFYRTAHATRKRLFGVIEYDVSPTTTLSAGASDQWDDATPFIEGLPLYENGDDPKLPRDLSLAFDWSFQRVELREAYLQYRTALGENWGLKLNAARWSASVQHNYGSFSGALDPGTGGIESGSFGAQLTRTPNPNQQTTFDATLTAVFDWLGRREELAFGADFTRFTARVNQRATGWGGARLADIRAFDPRDIPDPSLSLAPIEITYEGPADARQYGAFASLRVYLDDAWSIIAGARMGSNDTEVELAATVGPGSIQLNSESGNHNVITPYGGLMYDINDRYSLYASYADIYKTPSLAQQMDGTFIGASHGVNLEMGIKGSWRAGALNGALSLYRIHQDNVPLRVPTQELPPDPGLYCCFTSGTSRSKGADLELNGEITPGSFVAAGYTYNVNEAAGGGLLSFPTPRHLLKLWTNTELEGALTGWSLGGGFRAQTKTRTDVSLYCDIMDCHQFYIVQSPHAIIDLRTAYTINSSWQAAFSVNNVLDKVYYESFTAPALRSWYGEPRSFTLKIDGRF